MQLVFNTVSSCIKAFLPQNALHLVHFLISNLVWCMLWPWELPPCHLHARSPGAQPTSCQAMDSFHRLADALPCLQQCRVNAVLMLMRVELTPGGILLKERMRVAYLIPI